MKCRFLLLLLQRALQLAHSGLQLGFPQLTRSDCLFHLLFLLVHFFRELLGALGGSLARTQQVGEVVQSAVLFL